MANELAIFVNPMLVTSGSVGSPTGGLDDPYGMTTAGTVCKGMSYRPKVTGAAFFPFRVPNAVALATGLSFSLLLQDDVLNASAGKVAVFGVTCGPITSGTSTLDDAGVGASPLTTPTEVTATVTMPATAGAVSVLAIAIPNASLNSLAAGNWALLRVRRLGLNTSETHTGTVLLMGVDVRNT